MEPVGRRRSAKLVMRKVKFNSMFIAGKKDIMYVIHNYEELVILSQINTYSHIPRHYFPPKSLFFLLIIVSALE